MNEYAAKSIYLALQSVRREPITSILNSLEVSQWDDEEKLLEEQWRKFKSLIEFSFKHNSFYRKKFKEAGVEPGDVKSRDDLGIIPVLTKKEIRANYSEIISGNPSRIEKQRTSGSTGEPLKVIRDRASTGYHRANIFRQRRWFGSDIGSFEATFRLLNYPFPEGPRVKLKDWILNRVRLNEKDLSSANMDIFYSKLRNTSPRHFYGFPSLIRKFTDFLIKSGVEPGPFKLNSIFTTGEMLYNDQRKLFSEYFNAPVANEYGCTEVGIIACECPANGWHVPVESCLVEIVPIENPALSDDGGRIIVTDLMNRAMPFIRYDVGDIANSGFGKCECGRGLPTISGLSGRIGSLLNLPDGREVHSFIFFNIFKKAESIAERSIGEFQVRYQKPNIFEFYIIPDEKFNDVVMRYIQERVVDALGQGCDLRYHLVDKIDYSSNGKFDKFIVVDNKS